MRQLLVMATESRVRRSRSVATAAGGPRCDDHELDSRARKTGPAYLVIAGKST